jgi:hypothetical protein
MNASAKCPHPGVEVHTEFTAMTDTNVRAMQLMVKCAHCKQQFTFLGLPMGVSLSRPTMSVDGSVLYAPMVPEGEEPDKQLPEMIARRVV